MPFFIKKRWFFEIASSSADAPGPIFFRPFLEHTKNIVKGFL